MRWAAGCAGRAPPPSRVRRLLFPPPRPFPNPGDKAPGPPAPRAGRTRGAWVSSGPAPGPVGPRPRASSGPGPRAGWAPRPVRPRSVEPPAPGPSAPAPAPGRPGPGLRAIGLTGIRGSASRAGALPCASVDFGGGKGHDPAPPAFEQRGPGAEPRRECGGGAPTTGGRGLAPGFGGGGGGEQAAAGAPGYSRTGVRSGSGMGSSNGYSGRTTRRWPSRGRSWSTPPGVSASRQSAAISYSSGSR
jgi:hypothetical protein